MTYIEKGNKKPPMPIEPCFVCKGTKYWWSELAKQWYCSLCYGNPNDTESMNRTQYFIERKIKKR